MLTEIFTLYRDRWDFFLQLMLQHITISLIAIVCAGVVGLCLGILSAATGEAGVRFWD